MPQGVPHTHETWLQSHSGVLDTRYNNCLKSCRNKALAQNRQATKWAKKWARTGQLPPPVHRRRAAARRRYAKKQGIPVMSGAENLARLARGMLKKRNHRRAQKYKVKKDRQRANRRKKNSA
jgi:hypothetical protein